MVDFRKHTGNGQVSKPIKPVEIYETLDRESDKGPLRPSQISILDKWYTDFRNKKDVILKLHTGQGKTIIGLLILQSKLNEGKGPTLYLCANKFLVNQTCIQAKQFGVNVVTAETDLPHAFLDSQQVLITNVYKLFNGLTRFGLGSKATGINSIILDDAHACIDIIRDAFTIKLPQNTNPYNEIFSLFETEIKNQGAGTYSDIKRNKYDALLPVPYWDWIDKSGYVADILSKYGDSNEIRFQWPLIKDTLAECQCIISGLKIEIAPYLPPINLFKSFFDAEHRVYMSATVADDSFLVKVLGLNSATVENPLIYPEEHWSGEKMILIPSLIDESLDRGRIVEFFAKPNPKRPINIVALCPSFNACKDWEAYDAQIAKSDDIDSFIEKLKDGPSGRTLVIVNRYDGIDLPDRSCRILIFDSRPFPESLIDRYMEACLSNSEAIAIRIARKVEQGLGRSVRGEKDYSVILIIGSELIKYLQTRSFQKYFSEQTKTQINIGFQIAKYVKDELGKERPFNALINLINQCLSRDEGWKEFYIENMNKIQSTHKKPSDRLGIFLNEREAEIVAQEGQYTKSAQIIQKLIDEHIKDQIEKGWYLQEMARYTYRLSKKKSNQYQVEAHHLNRYLLKPLQGIEVEKLKLISQKRVDNIIRWVRRFGDYTELSIELEDILSNLRFGVNSDSFENALDRLGKCLGFATERPDKEWKEGPDNLWGIKDNEYVLFECKTAVLETRSEIEKSESEQMNSSSAWFDKNYKGCIVKRLMIIPTRKLSKNASFLLETEIIRKAKLDSLIGSVRSFFREFIGLDFKDLSSERINALIDIHQLKAEDIENQYSESVIK